MKTLERSQKLLSLLQKRDKTPELLARIARVEAEIKEFSTSKIIPVLPAAVKDPVKKKKKKIIKSVEVEVDEDEDET
jgi:hypothetical protein